VLWITALAVAVLASGALSAGPALATGTLTSSTPLLWDISCSASTLCAAVDDKGHAVISTDPGALSPTWSDSETGLITPSAISCAATALCVVVNTNGGAAVSTDPTVANPTWRAMPLGNPHSWIEDVSCPTTSLCVAVTREGEAITSIDPTADTPTWTAICPSSSLCMAVDTLGDAVISTDPGALSPTWSAPVHIDSDIPSGISCPTTSLCVVVDPSGRVVRSTDPTAATPTWSAPQPISDRNLGGVSCPATSLCVAIGEDVEHRLGATISTEPSAATPAWNATPILSGFSYPESPDSISCASTSLCVITKRSEAIVSTDPTAALPTWSQPTTIDAVPAGVLSVLGAPAASATGVTFTLRCVGHNLQQMFQIEGDGAVQECSGSATLSTTERLSVNGRVVTGVGAAATRRRSRTVTIGQTTLSRMYAGNPADTYPASVALNATGKRLLAKFKRLPATLSVSATASELRVPPKTVTVSTAHLTFEVKAAPRRKRCHRPTRRRGCPRAHRHSRA
jgi:hypothetical protein